MSGRIDVHHHVVVPPWAEEVARMAPGRPVRPWSVPEALSAMDRFDIERAVLSTTAPGAHFGNDRRARALAHATNEAVAQIVGSEPDRGDFFATLPLPDVEGTLAAIAHAYDDLGCVGVTMMSNAQGIYPGDDRFRPVWRELDRRRAVVFIHPNWPEHPGLPDMSAALSDFLLETVRSAIQLIVNDVVRDFPNVRIILSHAGGFLPYSIHRVAGMYQTMLPHPRSADEILAEARTFYFDLALSTSPTAMPALLAFADPSRVLYGSDWPYAPTETVDHFDRLYADLSLTADQRHAMDRGNAEALFAR